MSNVNLNKFLADRLRAAGKDLHNACKKMPEDKLSWHPPIEGNSGRDALDQLAECAYLNKWAASAFQEGAIPAFDETAYKQYKQSLTSGAPALQGLADGTVALAAAVDEFSPEKLADVITNPFTEQPTTWAEFADFFYWNTVYHEGQVNYIQVLYGDMS